MKKEIMKKEKYTGIKVIGFNGWLWFETIKIKKEQGRFIGKAGWGRNGAFTEINVNSNLIEGEITSETPQYL